MLDEWMADKKSSLEYISKKLNRINIKSIAYFRYQLHFIIKKSRFKRNPKKISLNSSSRMHVKQEK